MMSTHLILGITALTFSFILKLNQKVDFIHSSKLLLRFGQALLVLSLIVAPALQFLPVHQRPTLPNRLVFPAETVTNALSSKVAHYSFSRRATNIMSTRETPLSSDFELTPLFLGYTLYGILIGLALIRFILNLFKANKFLLATHVIKKRGDVRIALSDEITVPFSVLSRGLAWVVMPTSMLIQTKDFLIATSHELQHHRQKDTLWILFMEFAGTVLFINPAFYLWCNILSELQEFSCDEALIHGQRVSLHDYGDCLVRVAEAALENQSRLVGTASLTLMFGDPKKINSILIRRIKMFQHHLSSRFQLGRFMALGITTAVFTFALAYGATAKIEDVKKDKINSGVLVVDPEIQKIAEEVLTKAVKRFKATSGFALVSEPKTGRLLAVANTITIKRPNNPPHWGLKVRLQPASAMKALVAAKAVDLKLTNYDEQFNCHKGELEFAGNIYKDWKGFDMLSTRDMVVQSSNLCAMEVAQRLGPDNTFSMLKDFGFGRGGVTEGFPEARFGQALNYEDTKRPEFSVQIGTGYEIHITPLEMVQAFGTIANGGNLMKPLMANETADKAQVIRRVLTSKTADDTKLVLAEVLKRGTAKDQGSKIYELAGKTATASSPWLWDSNEQGGENNVGSFVGFGPLEDPKVLIYVGIYEPKDNENHSAHGSTHGGPVFREIAEKVLQHMNIKPTVSKN